MIILLLFIGTIVLLNKKSVFVSVCPYMFNIHSDILSFVQLQKEKRNEFCFYISSIIVCVMTIYLTYTFEYLINMYHALII